MVREGDNLKGKQIFELIPGQYRKREVLDSSDAIDNWIPSKPVDVDTLMFGLFMMQSTYFMRFCFTTKNKRILTKTDLVRIRWPFARKDLL